MCVTRRGLVEVRLEDESVRLRLAQRLLGDPVELLPRLAVAEHGGPEGAGLPSKAAREGRLGRVEDLNNIIHDN